MENLKRIIELMTKKKGQIQRDYFIPEIWNCSGYDKYSTSGNRPGEININPYDFLMYSLEKIMGNAGLNGGTDSSNLKDQSLCGKTIYSMLPRMFTAWNHYDEEVKPGTLLKAIALLPYLKSFGIDIIYTLPVFKYSSMYKKGELGCPYAIKDIYRLDPELHDELLGEYNDDLLETEFKAFVEACHLLGIKVIIDFVFRTVARDSDLIAKHPDWFYWIDLKLKDTFTAPTVDSLKHPTPVVNNIILKKLYSSPSAKNCLKAFRNPPDSMDMAEWEAVQAKGLKSNENILEQVEKQFGITTVPGFSDVVNDIQPAWSDVTYLKFYYDRNEEAEKYIDRSQPPYILQDGVKLGYYPGSRVNTELWEYISGVIPYYQEKFGIDGARIDMGHALPPELNRDIVKRAKDIDPSFVLWSEEFNENNSQKAREDGFQFITSGLWGEYKNYLKPGFPKRLYEILNKSVIPVTGALETADTPRAAYRYEKAILEQIIFVNYFIPNTIPLINNGQELMEIQPMNLGLDNSEDGRLLLDKADPMYSKLAFFDNYRMHWLNSDAHYIGEILKKGCELRSRFLHLILGKESAIMPKAKQLSKKALFVGYYDAQTGDNVFLLANRDLTRKARIRVNEYFPEQLTKQGICIFPVYSNIEKGNRRRKISGWLELEPGELLIACINN